MVRDLIDRFNPVTTVIISGGARGVDTVAAEYARERGMRVVEMRANWKKYGRGAGMKRNTEIVLAADDVAAFWDGESRGTFDSIRKARRHNRNLAIFDTDGNLIEVWNPHIEPLPTMIVPKGKKR